MNDSTTAARFSLSDESQRLLLDVARESVATGLRTAVPLVVDPAQYPPELQAPGAAFVTLKINGQLRGCIGTVAPYRPLVEDVAANAFAAAFQDPRFPLLQPTEYPQLHYDISVLGPLSPIVGKTEEEILRQVRPGIDGLVLQYGQRRGLLLPSVWQTLPDRRAFFRALKQKAGLPPDFWDPEVHVSRFETFSFGDSAHAT